MKISEADILIAPGLGNSGPDHWQRRWGARMPYARFIEQDNWDRPVLADWVACIHQEIMFSTRPVVLIGHSMSVGAIVIAARTLVDTKVRGAFLVSPPDFAADTIPPEARPFAPRTDPLPSPQWSSPRLPIPWSRCRVPAVSPPTGAPISSSPATPATSTLHPATGRGPKGC